MPEKHHLPLDWWVRPGPERDAALALCDQSWPAERAAFDDFAATTRETLSEGVDPAIIRTWWTAALLRRNPDSGPAHYAWMVSGLILRLAQSIQMDATPDLGE